MMETPELRSRIMRAVKGRDTGPEMAVRRLVHAMGFRFRLHRKDLQGRPDLVFPRLHQIVFVHGCFWHGHTCARGARVPARNQSYWTQKIARNKARDTATVDALRNLGWKVRVIWECEIKNKEHLKDQLCKFLGGLSDGSTCHRNHR
jgi:DNA mismatch endonuclease (patch repair protein)